MAAANQRMAEKPAEKMNVDGQSSSSEDENMETDGSSETEMEIDVDTQPVINPSLGSEQQVGQVSTNPCPIGVAGAFQVNNFPPNAQGTAEDGNDDNEGQRVSANRYYFPREAQYRFTEKGKLVEQSQNPYFRRYTRGIHLLPSDRMRAEEEDIDME